MNVGETEGDGEGIKSDKSVWNVIKTLSIFVFSLAHHRYSLSIQIVRICCSLPSAHVRDVKQGDVIPFALLRISLSQHFHSDVIEKQSQQNFTLSSSSCEIECQLVLI